jgi:HK97 family phage prohead protease
MRSATLPIQQLLNQSSFHEAARAGRANGVGVTRAAQVLRADDDAGRRVIRFTFSDGSVDRMGDTIDPNGWDLPDYKRNPVVLWAHDTTQPPIGRTVSIWSDGSRLLGDVEFATREQSEFADTVYRLLRGGYLKSGSVGFLPVAYDYADDDDRKFGIDFRRQALLEFSIVNVPANANALIAASAKGMKISRRDIRRLRRAADDATIGQCGRPLDEECGLKNPAECTIHAASWDGGDGGSGDWDGKAVRLRRARTVRRRIDEPLPPAGDSRDERLVHVAHLRARLGIAKLDPQIVAATSQFRMW